MYFLTTFQSSVRGQFGFFFTNVPLNSPALDCDWFALLRNTRRGLVDSISRSNAENNKNFTASIIVKFENITLKYQNYI